MTINIGGYSIGSVSSVMSDQTGLFWKVLEAKFLAKEAQIVGYFLGCCKTSLFNTILLWLLLKKLGYFVF